MQDISVLAWEDSNKHYFEGSYLNF